MERSSVSLERLVEIFRDNDHPLTAGLSSALVYFNVGEMRLDAMVWYNYVREYWSMTFVRRTQRGVVPLEVYLESRESLVAFKTSIYDLWGVRGIEGAYVLGEDNLLEALFSPTLVM